MHGKKYTKNSFNLISQKCRWKTTDTYLLKKQVFCFFPLSCHNTKCKCLMLGHHNNPLDLSYRSTCMFMYNGWCCKYILPIKHCSSWKKKHDISKKKTTYNPHLSKLAKLTYVYSFFQTNLFFKLWQ